MSYISTIPYQNAEGELKEVYNNILASRGKLAAVHQIQSLNPKSIADHMELYMTVMFGRSPLKRVQREMMAVVVSASNNCSYCIKHHAEAVLHYWKDEERVLLLERDYKSCGLSDVDLLLCQYAESLTLNPSLDNSKWATRLKGAGLDDRSILDASLVVAYFNFVNRLVLSLGVALTEEEMKGYNY